MAFVASGATFEPLTTQEHANLMLQYMNTQLSLLGVPLISASTASMIWQDIVAAGNMQQDYDNDLLDATNSFNVSQCSDQQVLNCLPITGTKLISASYSQLNIKVTASSAGSCTVLAGVKAVYNPNINFVVNTTTVIPAGASMEVPTTCDTAGPIQVTIGQITSFTTTFLNLASVYNDQIAIVGTNQETIPQLRQRIINGKVIQAGINGVQLALSSLPGISQAAVYFNPSSSTSMSIIGTSISLPPKNALIVIAGTSPLIAQTYYEYMLSVTYNATGSALQNFTTTSGQNLPVYFLPATQQPIYVRVHVSNTQPQQPGYAAQIQLQVSTLTNLSTLGQYITSEFIVQNSLLNFTLATIIGVEVSLDGTTWSFAVQTTQTAIPEFLASNVTVVSP